MALVKDLVRMNPPPAIPIAPAQLPQQPQQLPQQQQPQQPAAAAPAKPEDEDGANGGTTSIDTFQEYKPTALPQTVVRACNEWYNCTENQSIDSNSTTEQATNNALPKNDQTGIDLIDLSEDSNLEAPLYTINSSDNDPSATEDSASSTNDVSLSVPSHTSSACESALLSSVSAPMVPLETAECLLPLLANTSQPSLQQQPSKRPPPLSPLQLEGVLLSIQKHRRIHHASDSGGQSVRAGFFLGDGAGIGKGRQISAMLRDGFCRGRKRHVWLSVSRELIKDAQRDLKDIGLHCANDFVHDGTKFLTKGGKVEKGVLFLTYNLLVSANRIEQIIGWCAGTEHLKSTKSQAKVLELEQNFDGCIVFDEAHKAKNLADNTKTAQLVLMLQRRLPMARVVYCSATGVSEIDQLAYAERLGLWNMPHTTKPTISYEIPDNSNGFANFDAFKRSLEKRGLGSLELLALELKTRGSFMARTLSWEGAEFQTAEVPLDDQQRLIYDRCVSWWNKCQVDICHALEFLKNLPNSNAGSQARQLWGTFWAAHQRCFKELAICAKIPFLANDALQHIENNCCVVFGLQGTGEAGMQSLLSEYDAPSNSKLAPVVKTFPSLMSTVSACLTNFVKQHFPVAPFPPDMPFLPKQAPTTDQERMVHAAIQAEIHRIQALPAPQPIPMLVEKRQLLLEAVRHMNLPANPLDDLIHRLGGVDCVAEMTGRSGRIVQDPNHSDRFVYSKRVEAKKSNVPLIQRGEESDRINLHERRLFMDGTKSAAIISDAASTGVSLHAAYGSGASHKRRVHYTIELPWSADKAVQQLGRSHRSGQESAPIYKLVVTNLGGERRFAAAVSKRLASLGALTKGDRRAATGSDMSEFDLDSKYGKRALKRFYNALEESEASAGESSMGVLGVLSSESGKAKSIIETFIEDSKSYGDAIVRSLPANDEKLKIACVLSIAMAELERVGLDKSARSKADVRVFLNRLSGLMVVRQSLVFSLFMSTLGGVINIAKTSGEFEGTAEDLAATAIEIEQETDLGVDPSSGALTKLTTLVLDRGIPFEAVRAMAMEEAETVSPTPEEEVPVEQEEDDEEIVDLDGFIVNDNDPRDRSTRGKIAESGFYLSKNRIAGRYLLLFAKRKFDPSKFKNQEERLALDPLSLMQITRPNTGLNLNDKSSKDLRQKYRLLLSCDKLQELSLEAKPTSKESAKENEDPQHLVSVSKKVESLWKAAFKESDSFKHENGLAPRRQRVRLVNGPVLHILPALESVVRFRSEKEKALKIMRAQVESRRIVGVRFPSDSDALEKLLAELDTIQKARKNAGKSFTDEPLAPIDQKTMAWATTERKTMKSFFKVTSASNPTPAKPANGKRSSSMSVTPASSAKKPKQSTKTMMSYFAKKK